MHQLECQSPGSRLFFIFYFYFLFLETLLGAQDMVKLENTLFCICLCVFDHTIWNKYGPVAGFAPSTIVHWYPFCFSITWFTWKWRR